MVYFHSTLLSILIYITLLFIHIYTHGSLEQLWGLLLTLVWCLYLAEELLLVLCSGGDSSYAWGNIGTSGVSGKCLSNVLSLTQPDFTEKKPVTSTYQRPQLQYKRVKLAFPLCLIFSERQEERRFTFFKNPCSLLVHIIPQWFSTMDNVAPQRTYTKVWRCLILTFTTGKEGLGSYLVSWDQLGMGEYPTTYRKAPPLTNKELSTPNDKSDR